MVEWRDPIPLEQWDRAPDLHVPAGQAGIVSRGGLQPWTPGEPDVFLCNRYAKWDDRNCGNVYDAQMMIERSIAVVDVEHYRLGEELRAEAAYVSPLNAGHWIGDAVLFVFHADVGDDDRCESCGKLVHPRVRQRQWWQSFVPLTG